MNLEYLRLQSAVGTLATADLHLERGMPASIEAEKSILGAILLDNLAYNEAAETLKADDFYLETGARQNQGVSKISAPAGVGLLR